MYLGRNAQHAFAGVWLLWGAAQLFARLQIIVYCLLEGRTQFGHRLAVEAHNVVDARDVADQGVILVAVFDASRVCIRDSPSFSW